MKHYKVEVISDYQGEGGDPERANYLESYLEARRAGRWDVVSISPYGDGQLLVTFRWMR